MSESTVHRPDVAPPGQDPWRLPRHIGATALAVVVVLVSAGWLLHWWGTLNPRVEGWASMSLTDGSSDAEATIQLTNRSLTEMTVTDARLVSSSPPGVHADVETTGVRLVPMRVDDPCDGPASQGWPGCSTGGGSWSTLEGDGMPLPATVAPGETVVLLLTTQAPPCTDGPSDPRWRSADVEVRSAWGRETTRSFRVGGSQQRACRIEMPPEGSPPADRAAAVAQIGDAFVTAYDDSLDQAKREARIDDTRGLPEATAQALAGPYRGQVAAVRPVVTEVSFDRPGHAVVRYLLGAPGVDPRVGDVVLVEGTWKITRATVCADLALAAATCPPLPR